MWFKKRERRECQALFEFLANLKLCGSKTKIVVSFPPTLHGLSFGAKRRERRTGLKSWREKKDER